MFNRITNVISSKMIVFYFEQLIFCFAAIACVIRFGTLLVFIL